MRVGPEAEVLRGDPADGGDCGGFGEDQRGAADGVAAEVHEVPRAGEAVGGAGVLAHRGDEDAVFEQERAKGERERGEEGGGGGRHAGWMREAGRGAWEALTGGDRAAKCSGPPSWLGSCVEFRV